MKILSPEQVYQADKFTIEKQEITSDELMERAAVGLFNWLHQRLEGAPVMIRLFCGIGNNGGDGVALARHLLEHGYHIEVYIVNYSEKRSEAFLKNLERLKERKIWPEFLDGNSDLPPIGDKDIVIDAIFGIGINRPPDDWVGALMQHINSSGAFVLSVDVPSGMMSDCAPEKGKIVNANYVLAIQSPKLGFFLPDTGKSVENWDVIEIALDIGFISDMDVTYHYMQLQDIRPWYKTRERFSHKGTFGHSVLIGGSTGKSGAIRMTAEACLRAGAGTATALVPKSVYLPLQVGVPELMVIQDPGKDHIDSMDVNLDMDSVGIGPGMGTQPETLKAFSNFLNSYDGNLVIDADGLNLLAKKPELLKQLPKGTILTPHPKELERLLGSWKDDCEKLAMAMDFCKKYGCILVIKGSYTITVSAERGYVNSTGNPGLATAGSGDVLTGIIAGLLAQGYEPLKAAIMGVFLHGLSADLKVGDTGFESFMASDIIDGLGAAYLHLHRGGTTQGEQEKK